MLILFLRPKPIQVMPLICLFVLVRNPAHADRDSALMPTGIPVRCRPVFRWQADRDSGACRPGF
jgi:hypothetical protein